MAVQVERMLFSAEQYEKMIETGILEEDRRVELIRGEIVNIAPIGLRHAGCVARLTAIFGARLGCAVIVWPQNPIRLTGHSEPEPDVALVQPAPDFYSHARPGPADVLLLVEVADTSATRDRSVKVPLSAEAGIVEFWIVDLVEDVIEMYSDPAGGAYRRVRKLGRGESLTVPVLRDVSLTVDEVLG